METPALEEGEPATAAPRPASRYERIRVTAVARGIPLPTILLADILCPAHLPDPLRGG
jgi:hypothetical protein